MRASCRLVVPLVLLSAVVAAPTAMAATARVHVSSGFAPDMLFYTAARGERNAVVVDRGEEGNPIRIVDPGAEITAGEGCRSVDTHTVVCRSGSPIVSVGDRADSVSLVAFSATVYGGSGNDVLRGGPEGDVLRGEGGRDRLEGGPGSDMVEGDNRVAFGDELDGGSGTDHVSYSGRREAVRVDLADSSVRAGARGERDRVSNFEQVDGGRGDDTLLGSDAANYIDAGFGSNRVVARGGNDYIELDEGRGSSVISAGAGDDQITSASRGGDRITCGAGSDTVDTIGPDLLRPDCEGWRVFVGELVTMPAQPVVEGRTVSFTVPCADIGAGLSCSGTLSLLELRGRRPRARFEIPPGTQSPVHLRLTRRQRARAETRRGLTVLVRLNVREPEPGGGIYRINLRAPSG